MDTRLRSLAEHYRRTNADTSTTWQRLCELYRQMVKNREQALLDAATAAAAVYALFSADRIDTSQITPQMEEAFQIAFPGKTIESLAEASPEELQGYLSSWKGKYFEVLVRDKLNAGEPVGGLWLEPGQTAVLADSPTQSGWDIQIQNADGTAAAEWQLKASESLSYVKKALEKYPDIGILTTEEVSDTLGDGSLGVFSSGISDTKLEQTIIQPMESLFDSSWENLCETVLPFLPFLVIAIGEGRKVLVGRQSLEMALSRSVERAVKTGVAIGVGGLVVLMDGGLLSIPATLATRIGIERYSLLRRAGMRMESSTQSVRSILTAPTFRQLQKGF